MNPAKEIPNVLFVVTTVVTQQQGRLVLVQAINFSYKDVFILPGKLLVEFKELTFVDTVSINAENTPEVVDSAVNKCKISKENKSKLCS